MRLFCKIGISRYEIRLCLFGNANDRIRPRKFADHFVRIFGIVGVLHIGMIPLNIFIGFNVVEQEGRRLGLKIVDRNVVMLVRVTLCGKLFGIFAIADELAERQLAAVGKLALQRGIALDLRERGVVFFGIFGAAYCVKSHAAVELRLEQTTLVKLDHIDLMPARNEIVRKGDQHLFRPAENKLGNVYEEFHQSVPFAIVLRLIIYYDIIPIKRMHSYLGKNSNYRGYSLNAPP